MVEIAAMLYTDSFESDDIGASGSDPLEVVIDKPHTMHGLACWWTHLITIIDGHDGIVDALQFKLMVFIVSSAL